MLTTGQLQTLKAAILAETNTTFVALRAANDETGMADWLNAASTFIVWRTSVTQDEIMQNGFDWTRVDNLSFGKARIWEWMFNNEARAINPSNSNVRAGIESVWVGTAADLAVRASVYAHCKRAASRAERVFATGTGTDASPGLLGWEGYVTAQTVSDALRS